MCCCIIRRAAILRGGCIVVDDKEPCAETSLLQFFRGPCYPRVRFMWRPSLDDDAVRACLRYSSMRCVHATCASVAQSTPARTMIRACCLCVCVGGDGSGVGAAALPTPTRLAKTLMHGRASGAESQHLGPDMTNWLPSYVRRRMMAPGCKALVTLRGPKSLGRARARAREAPGYF